MDQDRKFLDTFIIVIGALVLLTVFIHFLSAWLAEKYIDVDNSENPFAQQSVAERIEPVGQVRTSDDPMPARAPAGNGGGQQQAAAAAQPADGKAVYEQACFACHGTGAAGAPKLGDAAAWKSRLAKGMETLGKHAIEGFTGETGVMPPKGGRGDLSDEQVLAAVKYMVEQSQ